MTEQTKLKMLKTMTGETDDSLLSTYLEIAAGKVSRRAYPFATTEMPVPEQYEMIQIEVAAYLIHRIGTEGETAHSENGTSSSYEDGDVPPSLLRGIVPYASLIGE